MFGELQDGVRYLKLKVTAVGVQKTTGWFFWKNLHSCQKSKYLYKKSVKTFQDFPDIFNVYN